MYLKVILFLVGLGSVASVIVEYFPNPKVNTTFKEKRVPTATPHPPRAEGHRHGYEVTQNLTGDTIQDILERPQAIFVDPNYTGPKGGQATVNPLNSVQPVRYPAPHTEPNRTLPFTLSTVLHTTPRPANVEAKHNVLPKPQSLTAQATLHSYRHQPGNTATSYSSYNAAQPTKNGSPTHAQTSYTGSSLGNFKSSQPPQTSNTDTTSNGFKGMQSLNSMSPNTFNNQPIVRSGVATSTGVSMSQNTGGGLSRFGVDNTSKFSEKDAIPGGLTRTPVSSSQSFSNHQQQVSGVRSQHALNSGSGVSRFSTAQIPAQQVGPQHHGVVQNNFNNPQLTNSQVTASGVMKSQPAYATQNTFSGPHVHNNDMARSQALNNGAVLNAFKQAQISNSDAMTSAHSRENPVHNFNVYNSAQSLNVNPLLTRTQNPYSETTFGPGQRTPAQNGVSTFNTYTTPYSPNSGLNRFANGAASANKHQLPMTFPDGKVESEWLQNLNFENHIFRGDGKNKTQQFRSAFTEFNDLYRKTTPPTSLPDPKDLKGEAKNLYRGQPPPKRAPTRYEVQANLSRQSSVDEVNGSSSKRKPIRSDSRKQPSQGDRTTSKRSQKKGTDSDEAATQGLKKGVRPVSQLEESFGGFGDGRGEKGGSRRPGSGGNVIRSKSGSAFYPFTSPGSDVMGTSRSRHSKQFSQSGSGGGLYKSQEFNSRPGPSRESSSHSRPKAGYGPSYPSGTDSSHSRPGRQFSSSGFPQGSNSSPYSSKKYNSGGPGPGPKSYPYGGSGPGNSKFKQGRFTSSSSSMGSPFSGEEFSSGRPKQHSTGGHRTGSRPDYFKSRPFSFEAGSSEADLLSASSMQSGMHTIGPLGGRSVVGGFSTGNIGSGLHGSGILNPGLQSPSMISLNSGHGLGSQFQGTGSFGSSLHSSGNLGSNFHSGANLGSSLQSASSLGSNFHSTGNLGASLHSPSNLGSNFHSGTVIGSSLHPGGNFGLHSGNSFGSGFNSPASLGGDLHTSASSMSTAINEGSIGSPIDTQYSFGGGFQSANFGSGLNQGSILGSSSANPSGNFGSNLHSSSSLGSGSSFGSNLHSTGSLGSGGTLGSNLHSGSSLGSVLSSGSSLGSGFHSGSGFGGGFNAGDTLDHSGMGFGSGSSIYPAGSLNSELFNAGLQSSSTSLHHSTSGLVGSTTPILNTKSSLAAIQNHNLGRDLATAGSSLHFSSLPSSGLQDTHSMAAFNNEHLWAGTGESPGRVKIQVFRGPSQNVGQDKPYAPWGYFVSQPSDAEREAFRHTHF